METFQILFLLIFFPCLIFSQSCSESSQNSNCEFYEKCLEDKYHCGDLGFPMAFGKNFCEKFMNSLDAFSNNGKECIENTNICLKEALDNLLIIPTTNCYSLFYTAFESFSYCLASNGYCDLFFDPTNIVNDVKGILNVFGINSMADKILIEKILITTSLCGQSVVSKLEEIIRFILEDKNNHTIYKVL